MMIVNIHIRNVKFFISDLFKMAQNEDIRISHNKSENYFTVSLSNDVLIIKDSNDVFTFETHISLKNDEYIFTNNADEEDVKRVSLNDDKKLVFVPQELLYYIDNESKNDEQNEIEALFG